MAISSTWSIYKKTKPYLLEQYFIKHRSNISPLLSIMLYTQQGFDYQGTVDYLNSYLQFNNLKV